MSFAYLGPQGTFTEEALLSLEAARDAELVSFSTVTDVVRAVGSDTEIEAGLIPIENSIEGSVNATLDMLAFGSDDVHIIREVVRPIRHVLLARSGVKIADLRAVLSHPHATAQCRGFLDAKLRGVDVRAANSTAEAAQIVSERGPVDPWAAIGTELAAELYGLTVLEKNIEDRPDNETRFVLVGREQAQPTGNDKTSIVCFIEKDRPGSLLAILHEFSDRQINLTKLESRPTKERLGEYCFFIDMDGHVDEPPVRYAIESLRTKVLDVKVLGAYPRA